MPNVPITLPDGAVNKDVLIDFTTVGSGTNPHNAADYVGGVYPAGRVTIPSGQTSVNIPYAFNPDSDVERDETSTMSFSSPTAGVVISPGSVTLTGLNDDSAPAGGDTIVYGPQTTADTGYVQTNQPNHRISGKLADVAPLRLTIASDSTGANAILWEYGGFNSWALHNVTNGNRADITPGTVNLSGNPDFVIERSGGRIKMTVGGTALFDRADTTGQAGTYARFEVGGGQPVTITSLAS